MGGCADSSGGLHLLIVDPRCLTRDCLVAAFADAPDVRSVQAAGNTQEAASILARTPMITTSLLNLAADAFDQQTLTNILAPLHAAAPTTKTLVLTNHIDAEHVHSAMRLGVDALLSSEMSVDLTLDAIRIISRGWVVYPSSLLEQPTAEPILLAASVQRGRDEKLTFRQRQVLEGLSRGMTNRQIALRLVVTERTVKAHVKELMRRLGASNRTQVVAIAGSAGPRPQDEPC